MRGTMRIAVMLLGAVWGLAACDGGGGGDADAGPDGGTDTDPDCAEGDTFDEADCPESYPDYSCVVFVDGSLDASGDGFSWGGAKRTVQEGLDLARCGVLKTSVCDQWQVWVRAGRYHVHQGCREHTVRLRKNVGLYGGFAGGETALEERDWTANETILDGASAGDADQRVFHVVTADDSTRLDGFTVTGGLADGSGDNLSAVGGGMLVDGKKDVSLAHCAIRENDGVQGGGLGLWGFGELTISDCVFERNRAFRPSEDFPWVAYGAGIYALQAGLVIEDSVFRGNTVEDAPDWGAGGAIMAWQMSHFQVDGSLIENNSAMGGSAGGIVLVSTTDEVTIKNTVFLGNTADIGPGAINVFQIDSMSITDCVFKENTAGLAGALWIDTSSVAITDCEFESNEALSEKPSTEMYAALGGAIYIYYSTVDIAGSAFLSNRSLLVGGATVAVSSTVAITDSSFSGNTALSDIEDELNYGGALFALFGDVELRGVVFEDNEASDVGGAVAVDSLSAFDIEACVFARNSAGIDGGAMMVWDSPASLGSSVLFDNAAAYGGAVCLATDDDPLPTSIDIQGATFFGNTASEAGGAVYARTGTVSAGNSVFWGNGPDVFAWDDGVDPAVATYCDVQGGWTGAGNLDADPLFTDAAAGNFRLLPGSPCIDAADGTTATELDIDGNPRVDDPAAPNTGLGPPWADLGAHERQP